MNADTFISDLVDRGEPLDENGQAYLEVDRDAHQAVVVWREPLAFHIEYNGERWSEHADSDGWLTGSAELRLAERLTGILARHGVNVDIFTTGYNGEDEPTLTFEIVTNYHAGEKFGEWFDRIGWPIVATLTNVTDPGTFGSPYLFDMGEL